MKFINNIFEKYLFRYLDQSFFLTVKSILKLILALFAGVLFRKFCEKILTICKLLMVFSISWSSYSPTRFLFNNLRNLFLQQTEVVFCKNLIASLIFLISSINRISTITKLLQYNSETSVQMKNDRIFSARIDFLCSNGTHVVERDVFHNEFEKFGKIFELLILQSVKRFY